jgi:hypothetical protein
VYVVPLLSPEIKIGEVTPEAAVHVTPPSVEYWYPMIGALTSLVPAVKGTARYELPAVSVEMVGAPGRAAGTALTRGVEAGPGPAALVATAPM